MKHRWMILTTGWKTLSLIRPLTYLASVIRKVRTQKKCRISDKATISKNKGTAEINHELRGMERQLHRHKKEAGRTWESANSSSTGTNSTKEQVSPTSQQVSDRRSSLKSHDSWMLLNPIQNVHTSMKRKSSWLRNMSVVNKRWSAATVIVIWMPRWALTKPYSALVFCHFHICVLVGMFV